MVEEFTIEDDGRRYRYIVTENQARIRLDKFLCRHSGAMSRSQLQKLIDNGNVTIDARPTKASHLIQPGEVIDLIIPKPKPPIILPENIPLTILYEDAHLLVVNKVAGMVVHPAYGNMSGTLVNALLYHCGDLSGIGGVKRPGIVHRLDKETSGLLVVAKDDVSHRQLSMQFAQRTIEREYQAVVWGYFLQNEGKIDSNIARSSKDRIRMITSTKGKEAITSYYVIKPFSFLSWISLKLTTGRTHQIRVHLSSIGHPVFGDRTYGGRQKRLISLNKKDQQLAIDLLGIIPRQALHAKTLGFWHPLSNKFLRFDSELPSDMQRVIQLLEIV